MSTAALAYIKRIKTERLTPRFCIEVVLELDDSTIDEDFILQYQLHITKKELNAAYIKHHATTLTRQEKIVLLENKYKTILENKGFEQRNHILRQMIRRMRTSHWLELLEEFIYG